MTQQTVAILSEFRSDSAFHKTWDEGLTDWWRNKKKNNIDSPKLPRKRTIPLKLGGGKINSSDVNSVQEIYKINIYYVLLDIIIK